MCSLPHVAYQSWESWLYIYHSWSGISFWIRLSTQNIFKIHKYQSKHIMERRGFLSQDLSKKVSVSSTTGGQFCREQSISLATNHLCAVIWRWVTTRGVWIWLQAWCALSDVTDLWKTFPLCYDPQGTNRVILFFPLFFFLRTWIAEDLKVVLPNRLRVQKLSATDKKKNILQRSTIHRSFFTLTWA